METLTNADEWMRLIREAVEEPDPARSNRKITGVHYRLGQALQSATGGPSAGANFHSWAVWGSRKAGVTIRQEDLDSAIENAQKTAGAVGGVVGFGASRVALRLKVRRFPGDVPAAVALGAICGAAAGRAIGNCLAVLHEHIRLQPCISGSMPWIIRECVTKRMMTFEVGERVLAVNEDVTPTGESSYPATLRRLDDAELVTFLYGQKGWDYSGGTSKSAKGAKGTAATDWTRIEQRMAYIVRLFRAYHLDPAVSQKPFAEASA